VLYSSADRSTGEVEVAGEAAGGREALRLIEELQPDIVLLDITAPGMSGLEVLTESAKRLPQVRVIVLTVHEAGDMRWAHCVRVRPGISPKALPAMNLKKQLKLLRAAKPTSRATSPGKRCLSRPGLLTMNAHWKSLRPASVRF